MQAPNLYIQNFSFAYPGQVLFENLNLTLKAGQWTALLGPSGTGKSSLLRAIAHLTSKEAHVSGKIISEPSLSIAHQIAYMAQDDLLFPWLSVLDNCLISTKLRPCTKKNRQVLKEHAIKMLAHVGLAQVLSHLPNQLSGGMKQRAALIRTFLEKKPIILMDEPFSALDPVTRYHLHTFAKDLLNKQTVFFITHDPEEAVTLAHHIYLICTKTKTVQLVPPPFSKNKLFRQLCEAS